MVFQMGGNNKSHLNSIHLPHQGNLQTIKLRLHWVPIWEHMIEEIATIPKSSVRHHDVDPAKLPDPALEEQQQ
jgi:hypothetical protein